MLEQNGGNGFEVSGSNQPIEETLTAEQLLAEVLAYEVRTTYVKKLLMQHKSRQCVIYTVRQRARTGRTQNCHFGSRCRCAH